MIKLQSPPPPGTGGFLRPAEILDKLEISAGMKIADFGCGSGYFTIPLARKVGKEGIVYAIDVLDSALNSVTANAKLSSLINVETVRGDLEVENGSGLLGRSVDLVLLANILYQAKDKAGVINEAKRVLKDNGKIAVIEWTASSAFGPPVNSRISKEEVKNLARAGSLVLEKEFDAWDTHYGLVFSL